MIEPALGLGLPVAQTIDLSDPGPNWAQLVLGFAIVTAVIAFAIVRWYKGRQAGTADAQRRHRRVLNGQLKNATGKMVLVTKAMDGATRRRHIRAALPGLRRSTPGDGARELGRTAAGTTATDGGSDRGGADAGTADSDDPDDDLTTPPTVRAALLRSVRAPLTALPDLPPLLLRLTTEAVATLVLGSLLFVGLATWRKQLHAGTDAVLPSFSAVGQALGTLGDGVLTLLGFFPFAKYTWALLLPVVMRLGSTLYQHWLVTALLLTVGVIVIGALEYHLGDVTERVHTEDLLTLWSTLRATARIVIAMAVAGVAAGLLGTAISGALHALATAPGTPALVVTVLTAMPLGGLADVAAVVLVVLVGAYLAVRTLRRTWTRTKAMLVEAARTDTAATVDRLGYLVIVRSVYAALSIIVAPIILVYAVELVTSGRLAALLALVATAPVTTKVSLGFVAAVLLFVVVLRAREELVDAASMWPLALGQKTVTAFLFLSLGPFIVGIVIAIVLFVLGTGWVPAILVGLFAMTVLRLATVTVQRGAQKGVDIYRHRRARVHEPNRAYLAGYELHDANDRPIHVLRVNSRTILAHRDPRRLCDTALALLGEYFEYNDLPQTVAEHYWENVEAGLVDWGHTEGMVRQEARRSIKGHLREHDGLMRRETLLDKLADERAFTHVDRMYDVVEPMFPGYDPGSVVEEQLRYLQTRAGTVEGRRDGEVLVLTE